MFETGQMTLRAVAASAPDPIDEGSGLDGALARLQAVADELSEQGLNP